MADEAQATAPVAKEPSPRARLMETLGAVIVGAVIADLASYVVASQQTEATNEEALRTQRLTAYSQFIADSREFEHVHGDFVRLLVTGPPRYSNEAIATIKKPVDDAFRKVNQDVSLVDLVGSTRAATIAEDIFMIDTGRHQSARNIELFLNLNLPDDQYSAYKKSITDLLVAESRHRDDLLLQFTMQARADVDR